VLGTLCRCHRPPLSLVIATFTVLYCTYYSHSFFVVCCLRELVLSWTGQGRAGRQPATTAETHDLRFIPSRSWSHYHLGGRVEPWDEHKPAKSAMYPMKHLESTGPQNSTAEAPGMYGSMLSSGMDPSSYCTFTERSLGLASPIPCLLLQYPYILRRPSRLARFFLLMTNPYIDLLIWYGRFTKVMVCGRHSSGLSLKMRRWIYQL